MTTKERQYTERLIRDIVKACDDNELSELLVLATLNTNVLRKIVRRESMKLDIVTMATTEEALSKRYSNNWRTLFGLTK